MTSTVIPSATEVSVALFVAFGPVAMLHTHPNAAILGATLQRKQEVCLPLRKSSHIKNQNHIKQQLSMDRVALYTFSVSGYTPV
jgi:hypothetical protein